MQERRISMQRLIHCVLLNTFVISSESLIMGRCRIKERKLESISAWEELTNSEHRIPLLSLCCATLNLSHGESMKNHFHKSWSFLQGIKSVTPADPERQMLYRNILVLSSTFMAGIQFVMM